MITESRLNRMTSGIIDSIEAARKEQGLSMRELSERSGVSMQYLYRVCRNEHVPRIDVLMKVLTALGKRFEIIDDSVPSKI